MPLLKLWSDAARELSLPAIDAGFHSDNRIRWALPFTFDGLPLPSTFSKSTPPKVKSRQGFPWACDEKDVQGKRCPGVLIRWSGYGQEVKSEYGVDAEIYRCGHCGTVYLLPHTSE